MNKTRMRVIATLLLAMAALLACNNTSSTDNLATPTVSPTIAANPSPTLAQVANPSPTVLAVTNPSPTAGAANPSPTVVVADTAPSPTTTSNPNAGMGLTNQQLKAVPIEVPAAYRDFTPGSEINLPPLFRINVFAVGLSGPRMMAVAPNGDLFVAEINSGNIAVLRDGDHNGAADSVERFAGGLDSPHSLAFHDSYLYVATDSKVVRYPYQPGDLKARGDAETVVPNLPTGAGHHTRTLAFGPDGKLYVAAGSSCNVCEESDPRRAAISVYNLGADGKADAGRIFSKGLRNAVGLTFAPNSNNLWAVVNGRDNIGNDIPHEMLVQAKDGADYGWPYCYDNRVYDSDFGQKDASYCQHTTVADLMMQAHSAPLGLDFYTGQQFPSEFRGGLFVGFHGSWNRTPPTGYKLVYVPFKDGQPQPAQDFATGWLRANGNHWGRPVAPITGADGSLYLSDDASGVIYRIYFVGE